MTTIQKRKEYCSILSSYSLLTLLLLFSFSKMIFHLPDPFSTEWD